MVSRTRTGTLISPRPGSSMSMVPMRANIKMNAAPYAGRNETLSCIYLSRGRMILSENRCPLFGIMRRLPSDDARGEPRHVSLQHVAHERQRDQHGDEDRENFGNENESHFLDLRQCLKQRDDHADH